MKIGIVETGLPPHQVGGAEVQAWNLARQFQKKGHDVTIFIRRSAGIPKYERRDHIRIFTVKSIRRPFGILSNILGVFVCVARERGNLDVLLCFRAWPNGFAGLLAQKFLGLASCFSIRGGDWYFVEPYWWGKIIYRLLFASEMGVLVQTEKVRSEVVARFPDVEPLIIPNGIDVNGGYSPMGQSILFVGNLIPRKGVNVLIEAFQGLSGSTLKIVGDGPERSRLEEMAQGLSVEFVGRIKPGEIRQYMADHAKLLVLPAVAGEGMPNVLLEAMSIGIPVVASDIAGICDLLENGRAGILVDPGDVTGLRHALTRILGDNDLWKELSTASRETAGKYNWEIIVERWELLFESMLNSAPKEKAAK